MANQVAEFPPPRPALRRMPANPIDKSTIVSVYPKFVREVKNTIEPGIFEIPAGNIDKPSILVVGSSSWWSYSGDTRPTIQVPISSIQIAEAIIKDLAADFSTVDAGPGLFFVPGDISKLSLLELKVKFKESLEIAHNKQKTWFMALVRIADSLWARANGNPLCISDEMRLAARQLNLNDKPWLRDSQTVELVPCKACGSLKNPLFPICSVCKSIDPDYKGPEIKFAG